MRSEIAMMKCALPREENLEKEANVIRKRARSSTLPMLSIVYLVTCLVLDSVELCFFVM
jgi:hypothetical protein